jgi:hypothetical protein
MFSNSVYIGPHVTLNVIQGDTKRFGQHAPLPTDEKARMIFINRVTGTQISSGALLEDKERKDRPGER